ncbi:hypothetical protein PENNAL_c0026G11624 [Penicillium nalgiovense]|uniref:Uncharacterized protein n=1 Tax=Penicillium nalgiovense TaxID=60175 RepID=A0A1V6YB99_PENNA|nr:hypothetical protein PENNAL_c0026G11624 [Penicillium nalgiovense]
MEVPRSWFPIILDEGDKVTLNKPTRSEWVINKMANTDSYQCELQSANSYACVLFTYHDVADGQEAFMRVYFQVPHTSYEHADQATRAREATDFTPPELKAYEFLTKKRLGKYASIARVQERVSRSLRDSSFSKRGQAS